MDEEHEERKVLVANSSSREEKETGSERGQVTKLAN